MAYLRRRHLALKRRLLREEGRCRYCRREIVDLDDATLDHVVPLSKGGEDNQTNLVLCCHPCNAEKGNNIWDAGELPQPRDQQISEEDLMDLDW